MPSEKWTDKEVSVLNSLSQLGDISDVVDAFKGVFGNKRTSRAIKDKLRNVSLDEDDSLEDTIAEEEPLVELSPKINDMIMSCYEPITPQEKGYWTTAGQEWLQGFLQYARWAADDTKTLRYTYDPKTKALVVLISDIHVGKNPQAGPHAWAYRLASLAQRIKYLIENTEDEIDEIVFCLLGDLIEGENIFPSQNVKLVWPAFRQMQMFVTAFSELVNQVKAWFKKTRLAAVPGNHGRTAKTSHPTSNWDNVITYCLRLAFANDDKVEVIENYEPFYKLQVKDKTLLLTHKGVKHAGTPAMIQKIAGWVISKQVQAILKAHWHTPSLNYWLGIPIIGNGAGCGPDDLSEDMAKEEAAAQAYFFVEKDKPINGCEFFTWE